VKSRDHDFVPEQATLVSSLTCSYIFMLDLQQQEDQVGKVGSTQY
jgi:hypothetical protein